MFKVLSISSFVVVTISCNIESDISSLFSWEVVAHTSAPTAINVITSIVFFLLIFTHS